MIFSKTRMLAGLALAVAATSTPVFAQNVAVVNGTAIPSARADALLKTVPQQGQADPEQLHKAVREELINREVLMQEAIRQGIPNDPTVKQQMIMASQAVAIRALLEQYLKAHQPSDAELKAEYDQVTQQMGGGKEYHLHHILVDNEQQAKDLIGKIKGGANFEDLAKQFSKDPGSAKNGGDLDWSNPSAYVPAFGQAAEHLKQGQITDTPVHTQFGWHIIRLDGVRSQPLPPFDSVKAQLIQQAQKGQVEQYEAKLRGQAKIQ